MAFRFSTATRNKLLGRQGAGTGDGFSGIFYQSVIDVYTGSQPTSADNAPTGTYLGSITIGGVLKAVADGDSTKRLTFTSPSGGVITKTVAEAWQMVGTASGTAGWARLRTASDDGSISTTLPRCDMSIAVSGADLNFSSTAVSNGSPHTIDTFQITFPAD